MSTPTAASATATTLPHYHPHHYPPAPAPATAYSHSYGQPTTPLSPRTQDLTPTLSDDQQMSQNSDPNAKYSSPNYQQVAAARRGPSTYQPHHYTRLAASSSSGVANATDLGLSATEISAPAPAGSGVSGAVAHSLGGVPSQGAPRSSPAQQASAAIITEGASARASAKSGYSAAGSVERSANNTSENAHITGAPTTGAANAPTQPVSASNSLVTPASSASTSFSHSQSHAVTGNHDSTRSTSNSTAVSAAGYPSTSSNLPSATTLPSLKPNTHNHGQTHQHPTAGSAISAVATTASPSSSLPHPLSSRLPPPFSPYASGYPVQPHADQHQNPEGKRSVYPHDSYDYDQSQPGHHHQQPGPTQAQTQARYSHSSSLQSPVHYPGTHVSQHAGQPSPRLPPLSQSQHQSQYSSHQAQHAHNFGAVRLPLLSPAAHQQQPPLQPQGNYLLYHHQSAQLQRPHRPSPLTNIAHSSTSGAHYPAQTSAVSTPIASSAAVVTLPPLSALPAVPPISAHGHASSHHRYPGVLPPLVATPTGASPVEHGSFTPIAARRSSNMVTTTHQSPQGALNGQSSSARKRRRSRDQPDWDNFYKNGLPKEIIVIDDSPEPSAVASNTPSAVVYMPPVSTPNQPTSAKRRRPHDEEEYDALSHNTKHSASHTATPRINGGSMGYVHPPPAPEADTTPSSYKRRRTRGQLSEARIRETAEYLHDSAMMTYVPPPFPPKKAPDVNIRVVNDQYHRGHKVDDDDGHYIVVPDGDLTERYKIVKLLGQGTFGKVVQARDNRRNKMVAIKIIRSVQKYRDASKIELRVLATLKANDEENRNRCIHLRDCFDFRNHICIVMDLLGQSVFDFLKGNNFVPFPNSQIQSFARQLLTSVAFLHDLNLIHTDLKPENILLCDPTYQTFTYNRKIPSASNNVCRQAHQRRVLLDTEIRLIDFGSATFQDEYHSSVVSTRHYRAPEIILGLGWSYPCDIWSIGCILVEFFTGDALFQTHDNLEHLAMMEAVVDSRIDTNLVQMVNRNSMRNNVPGGQPSRFFKRLRLDFPNSETNRSSRRFVKAMKKLDDIIPTTSPFLALFLDLLKKIFVYNPNNRITAQDALKHPWFREQPGPDDGTEALKIRAERLRPTPTTPQLQYLDGRSVATIRN